MTDKANEIFVCMCLTRHVFSCIVPEVYIVYCLVFSYIVVTHTQMLVSRQHKSIYMCPTAE